MHRIEFGLTMILEATNYTELWNDMRESISLVQGGKRVPGQGTFAHITGGYEAGKSREHWLIII
jgi:hypothetical protein